MTDEDEIDDAMWLARELDRKIAAIAHPVRRYLLELLVWGDDRAGSLAASVATTFGISVSRASQHLQVLARASLVDVFADGPIRNYRLNNASFAEVTDWIDGLRSGRGAGR